MLVKEIELLFTKLIDKNVFVELYNNANTVHMLDILNSTDLKLTLHNALLYKPVLINNALKVFYGYKENVFNSEVDFMFYLQTMHPNNIITLAQAVKFVNENNPFYLNSYYTLKRHDGSWIKFFGVTKIVFHTEYGLPQYTLTLMEEIEKLPKRRNEKHNVYITGSEQKILEFILQDLTTKEIADKLQVSISTINTHRQNLMHKLNVKSGFGLIKKVIELGLITDIT